MILHLQIFAASLPRVYCACTTSMEMLRRLAHDLRDPTAFSPRSRLDRRTLAFVLSMLKTNARDSAIIGDHGDHRTMSGVSTTFLPRIPRLWRPWRALDPFSVAVDAQ